MTDLILPAVIVVAIIVNWKHVIGYCFPKLADRIDERREKRFIDKMIYGYTDGKPLLQVELRKGVMSYVRKKAPKPLPRRDTWGPKLNTRDEHDEIVYTDEAIEHARVRRITLAIEAGLDAR